MEYYSGNDLANDVIDLQHCFEKEIELTKEIQKADEQLKQISKQERPDMTLFQKVLNQKDACLAQLDTLSEEISLRSTAIEPYLKTHSFETDPNLICLKKLWKEAYALLDEVSMQEDFNFRGISDRLHAFRELLQSEFKIKEVPLVNRQIILPVK